MPNDLTSKVIFHVFLIFVLKHYAVLVLNYGKNNIHQQKKKALVTGIFGIAKSVNCQYNFLFCSKAYFRRYLLINVSNQ